jgi:hypothetical protein
VVAGARGKTVDEVRVSTVSLVLLLLLFGGGGWLLVSEPRRTAPSLRRARGVAGDTPEIRGLLCDRTHAQG